MKLRNQLLTGLIVTLALGAQFGIVGQSRLAKRDPAFNAFWLKFKAAVARNDKAKVADMTKLPFMIGGEDHDRAAFLKEYPSLFDRRTRRCFAREQPSTEGDYYEIFCDETIFLFGKVDGVWKFVEIGVND
ncbi:MAG: hypothetical protein QOD75_161 [Blastocatellia bacterium]|jgi:hypothetical protein|nr:hypothetical protein [Blastocatellia bacterium]